MKTLLFIIYILIILAIIFMERKSPTEALLWVLVLVCLPYVGLILYLVFGSTMAIKLTSYLRKKRLRQHYPDISQVKPISVEGLELSDEDRQVIHFNSCYNQSKLTSYQDIRIYTTGESHYRQLFQDIKDAEKCIYIEFYTIHNDVLGRALVNTLTKKAKDGKKVMVMCDFIANVGTPPEMFRPLKDAGGQIIRVKPFLTHYRSHRKIVAIDHKIAYIGGMNIGKKYANMDTVKTPWRDTQVRMTGACVSVLDEYFLTDWLCAVPRRQWKDAVSYAGSVPVNPCEPNKNLCQFIVGGVDNNKESVKMSYLSMIRSAKKQIKIQTPYFIPDTSILDALKTAAAAGVEVELMIPGMKASFFLDPVTTYYCGQLLEYGAKIHKYHGYIHAKAMVVDDELCCIGSVNMDMRSLMVDDEICGTFYANEMASGYSKIYNADIENCSSYGYDEFQKRSIWERFLEGLFLLFAPLM